jgi:hypothetical protein
MNTRSVIVVVAASLSVLLSACGFANAQQATASADTKPEPIPSLSGRPDVEGNELLGGTYENPLVGISFQTPANCKQVKSNGGDEIVRFLNEQRNWELVATKSTSSQPIALTADDKTKMGLLEVSAARLKQVNPSMEIVRQDTTKVNGDNVGILAARFSAGATQRRLIQQAIIQANDQLYYTLTMTTPGSANEKGGDSTDPNEVAAVNAFKQVLDSVKLLDRAAVKDDQNERLFRTRALYVNLTPAKIKSALIPEQWMRLLRDGHDIGYTYTVEESDNAAGVDGVKIGIRSRSYPDQNTQVDGETWYGLSGDRRHENWSNLVWVQDLNRKAADLVTELGSSDMTSKKVLVGQPPFPKGQNPPVQIVDVFVLNVQKVAKRTNAAPLKQDLPPWYLPQAMSHLLPRLLPIRSPKSFMFAVYVSDAGKVMHRYVEIGGEQPVELDGKQVLAIPISDRITLEGSKTIHYMSPEGKYLGSVNKESKITILPTDASTLQKIWQNKADLSRPKPAPQQPQQPQQPAQPAN